MDKIIQIEIPEEQVSNVKNFCEAVLEETYNRFDKDERTRFDRIFIGKLGEVAMNEYLKDLGIIQDTSTMFAVYPGTENVDPFDFIVPATDEKIDVKTAYRDFHSRILVPYGNNGQWDQMPKSYYVGVKFHSIVMRGNNIDFSGKFNPTAIIHGYIPRESPNWKGPSDFGEGPAKWVYLKELRSIHELIQRMESPW